MALQKIDFDANKIKLTPIISNTEKLGYSAEAFKCEKVEQVYGKLLFGEKPAGRPMTYASYVMSVDGKIAFEDNKEGPLVAKNNLLDPDGAFADFWMLNMLRGYCDGIIIGAGTLINEPEYSGSAYDSDIINARLEAGKEPAPWTIVITTSGKNIPYHNPVFKCKEVPILIATSPNGLANVKNEINRPYCVLDKPKSAGSEVAFKKALNENKGKIFVLVTGSGGETNAFELFTVLHIMGMERVLVESPAYCHHLMQQKLLDEIFITVSSVFVCGQAVGIGTNNKAFLSTDHPHCEIVSVHTHTSHFMYTRYRMIYGLK